MSTSLQNKTIRPGSLNGYSYYYSKRRPANQVKKNPAKTSNHPFRKVLALLIVAVIGVAGYMYVGGQNSSENPSNAQPAVVGDSEAAKPNNSTALATLPAARPSNPCAANTEAKLIKVSVEKRRLWACEGSKKVFDAAVITGLRGHPETETPAGTYHVYAKQQNTTLKGQDSRGAWNYPVYFWMPFLDNQHGTYGFHDATWRPESEFGSISPDSQQASHGCVELTKANAQWLYEWAPVRTTVIVEA